MMVRSMSLTKRLRRGVLSLTAALLGLSVLSGCGVADGDIVIGSADFGESEIVAEIYAIALEDAGYTVHRRTRIGARDAYIGALENDEINLIPEYSGNLLLFYDPESEATTPDDVFAELEEHLPEELAVYVPAEAENKDSLNVTAEFAEENGLESIADLTELGGFSLAGNPEFAERSFGVPGLERVYGIEGIDFVPISDGGGPATVRALLDGDVQVANIFSTTPSIVQNDLVTLEDPENLIAAQQIIPLLRSDVASPEIEEVLDAISAQLTTEDLLELNERHQGEGRPAAATVARDWLEDNDLI